MDRIRKPETPSEIERLRSEVARLRRIVEVRDAEIARLGSALADPFDCIAAELSAETRAALERQVTLITSSIMQTVSETVAATATAVSKRIIGEVDDRCK